VVSEVAGAQRWAYFTYPAQRSAFIGCQQQLGKPLMPTCNETGAHCMNELGEFDQEQQAGQVTGSAV